jgi:hypothetical protein
MYTKAQAQAFLDGINSALESYRGQYYWDDGASRDEQGNLLGPADQERCLSDWVGILVVTQDTFPKSLYINGVLVEPCLNRGSEYEYYKAEELYQA